VTQGFLHDTTVKSCVVLDPERKEENKSSTFIQSRALRVKQKAGAGTVS